MSVPSFQNFTCAVVFLRNGRKTEQRIRCRWKSRANGGTSVICETFIPRDCRIYFYVPGSRNFVQWRGERVRKKKRKETKKRSTNERAGAPIIRRILDYLFISPRFARTRRYSTCSQNFVSLVDEERSKKYFCIEEAQECKFADYLFSKNLQKS